MSRGRREPRGGYASPKSGFHGLMYDTGDVPYTRQPITRRGDYRPPVPGPPTNNRGEVFAALIREGRRRLGLTQDALVERSGVSRSTILRWESGDASRPDSEQVRAVCQALGIDPRRAAVALGYLEPEDLNPPNEPREPLAPDLEEVVEMLQDPRIPTEQKTAWVRYLRYLRDQGGNPPQQQHRAG